MVIKSKRFVLSLLTEADATYRYLSWFDDSKAKEFISYKSSSLDELKNYIKAKNNDPAAILLGIFTDGEHIGNIKYEPIDLVNKTATMGILLGEAQWRGKGVAAEVISISADYLAKHFHTETIILGVDKGNTPAISAYKKLGFEISEQTDHGLFMKKSLL
ncbi:GNAT family N-acetyltransferase [Pseudoalteromonas marina]|jgi:ribosomal-protein-alanine N-acetyltransferase|uniref:GNAT family N-acetyltransferase n=1 Tax=Pseudoalteromonas marina TaxID=267375 RepID=UPI002735C45A|nr:GNAT family N-acetyltransferase [Pseudoalteromonas marina]MDP2484380.1 GNAT family N-acetyltransferase [Pseudoalteromonas marina]